MKGMRLWLLFSWAAALYVGVMLSLSGGLSPADLNYDHFFVERQIALLFVMHAISLTVVFSILKKLVKDPPLPPLPPPPGEWYGPEI